MKIGINNTIKIVNKFWYRGKNWFTVEDADGDSFNVLWEEIQQMKKLGFKLKFEDYVIGFGRA